MKGIKGRLFLTPKGYDEAGDLGTPYKAQKCGYCGLNLMSVRIIYAGTKPSLRPWAGVCNNCGCINEVKH
jgi:hypothetical protein